jgi:hypothetical protein
MPALPDFLIWHCAGCGAAADGKKKPCDCATNVGTRQGPNGKTETTWWDTPAPDALAALIELEAALRTDSRGKTIMSDTVEYHLDGQTMYHAINKARAAIARATGEDAARLIAAAPDLLAIAVIAEQFMSVATDWNFDECEIGGKMRCTHELLRDVRAAIAKVNP